MSWSTIMKAVNPVGVFPAVPDKPGLVLAQSTKLVEAVRLACPGISCMQTVDTKDSTRWLVRPFVWLGLEVINDDHVVYHDYTDTHVSNGCWSLFSSTKNQGDENESVKWKMLKDEKAVKPDVWWNGFHRDVALAVAGHSFANGGPPFPARLAESHPWMEPLVEEASRDIGNWSGNFERDTVQVLRGMALVSPPSGKPWSAAFSRKDLKLVFVVQDQDESWSFHEDGRISGKNGPVMPEAKPAVLERMGSILNDFAASLSAEERRAFQEKMLEVHDTLEKIPTDGCFLEDQLSLPDDTTTMAVTSRII